MAPAPQTRLTPAEACRAILAEIEPLEQERVPLADALGRVLTADVTSPIDLPPWDNSAMDGYAARAGDVVAGAELRVVELIPAGGFPTRTLGPGECARIFTGAPVPSGADSVVRQEHTTRLDRDRVRIDDAHDAGRNVRPRAEDIAAGTVALTAGTEVGAAQMAFLAAMATFEVEVHRRPTVAILSTGDEVADEDEREEILAGRKIASSNTYGMAAAAIAAGADALSLGIVRDDQAQIRDRLALADAADLLVTSGGMSVGEHDHLRAILEASGDAMRFWRLRSRPGAPVGFGVLDGLPWLGLPGNPVSAMVTFELFARPAIRRLLGHRRLFRRTVPVVLGERLKTPARLTHFLRVTLTEEGDALVARLTGPQGSGFVSSMARADALLIVPEDRDEAGPGDTLRAIRLNEAAHVTEAPF